MNIFSEHRNFAFFSILSVSMELLLFVKSFVFFFFYRIITKL